MVSLIVLAVICKMSGCQVLGLGMMNPNLGLPAEFPVGSSVL